MHDPVVIRFSSFSSSFSKSTTHWMVARHDPSLSAMNLLLRKERTHPLTVTVWPNCGWCRSCLMLIANVFTTKMLHSHELSRNTSQKKVRKLRFGTKVVQR